MSSLIIIFIGNKVLSYTGREEGNCETLCYFIFYMLNLTPAFTFE